MVKKSLRHQNDTTLLALSSLHNRRANLDKEHQWLLKQIKRKRTELNNFVERMSSLTINVFQRCDPELQIFTKIDREIHNLFAEITSNIKLGKKSRKNITEFYYQLQLYGLISPQIQSARDEDDGEFYTFEPPESEPQADCSRNIRQVFLSLAGIFHPDKVKDEATQILHTEIMKEINRAYKESDLARLLEIEQEYNLSEIIDSSNEDDLNRICNRIEQQNQLLKNQYESLKQELRSVKNSPEGLMFSDYRKAAKTGVDTIDKMLEQVKSEIEILTAIRDFVREFRDNKITIKEFLRGHEFLRPRT